MEDVVAVCANAEMAITTNGNLWAWGFSSLGRFGDGAYAEDVFHLTPVKIMEDVLSISAGVFHTVAIRTDGSLWAWGSTRWGLLGDGTVTDHHTPISPVKIMDSVIAVSVGDTHTAAIRADGSLWAWGRNEEGQLGDGTTTGRYTPVKVMADVIAVSAGFNCTMAIKSDGSLWAWGSNWDGQLGDGTTTMQITPIRIMKNVVAVSAGGSFAGGPGGEAAHTIAVRTDGSLWAWGSSRWGQLGDGTTTDRQTPARILENVMLSGGLAPQPIISQVELRFVIGQTQYTRNGTPRIADAAPFIDPVYNRTMVPLRLIAEAFGAVVRWESATRTASIVGDGINLSLNLDTPLPGGMGIPIVVNGNTFVPLAYVAQQFGATTRWDSDARAVYVVQ